LSHPLSLPFNTEQLKFLRNVNKVETEIVNSQKF